MVWKHRAVTAKKTPSAIASSNAFWKGGIPVAFEPEGLWFEASSPISSNFAKCGIGLFLPRFVVRRLPCKSGSRLLRQAGNPPAIPPLGSFFHIGSLTRFGFLFFIYQLEGNPRYLELTELIFAWMERPGHQSVTSTIYNDGVVGPTLSQFRAAEGQRFLRPSIDLSEPRMDTAGSGNSRYRSAPAG
jgi:hypothetical protein